MTIILYYYLYNYKKTLQIIIFQVINTYSYSFLYKCFYTNVKLFTSV